VETIGEDLRQTIRAVYVNTLDGSVEDGEERVRRAYGANYERLKTLKQKYDPTNLLSQNSNELFRPRGSLQLVVKVGRPLRTSFP